MVHSRRAEGHHESKVDCPTSVRDGCGLPGKLKLWCLKYGLMPRTMGPLTVYEITHVESMERKLNKFMKRLLGVPRCMTNIALHGRQTRLSLPVKSLIEEF